MIFSYGKLTRQTILLGFHFFITTYLVRKFVQDAVYCPSVDVEDGREQVNSL